MRRSIVILSAPSNLGLGPPAADEEPGVNRMPVALKTLGIVDDLAATDRGTVPPPEYSPDVDPETGVRNVESIRAYTERLAGSIKDLVTPEDFLLVLGGDCSILLGSMLGLRRKGTYGLVFIDGHSDFQTPEMSDTGGAAGMDLAFVTGHGPDVLTRFDHFDSLVPESSVVAIGFQEDEDQKGELSIGSSQITHIDLESVHADGPAFASRSALSFMDEITIEGYWIHLDVDVLDARLMPAVDSPDPGGLTYEELTNLVLPLLCDPRAAGMEITIYDPARDPNAEFGKALCAWMVDVFTKAGFVN